MKTRLVKLLSIGILLLWALQTNAQQRFTLSGYVKDQQNGESLIGISVSKAGTGLGTVTNEYGFYSLTLPAGEHDIQFSYVGYTPIKMHISLKGNQNLDIKLDKSSSQLNTVTVIGDKKEKAVNTLNTSINRLDIAQIKKMPTFMGEVDVLRSIQTLPGVQTVGEGASGFNVRGGAADENLILLDEAPVYNSTHMLGFFSVFNPDAVKSVNLIKGGFPAEYGGRTSSVLDIRMKDGNNQNMAVNGGISNVFSRLSIEAPIVKDQSSFIVAARRSYIDILMKPFLSGDMKDTKLNFYDITAKANFKLNKTNTLFVSGYLGRDVFGFGTDVNMNWGNKTATVRWNHVFNNRLFLNLTTFYSNYDYSLKFNNGSTKNESDNYQAYNWTSNIINYGVKPGFTYYVNTKNSVHFGVQGIYYTFKPGKGVSQDGENTNIKNLTLQHGLEAAAYIDHEWKPSKKFGVQYGLRLSQYDFLGNSTAYFYNDTTPGIRKTLTGSKTYGSNEVIKAYHYLEPRINIRYGINDNNAVKASYSRTTQYMHQLSNTASPTPLDIWTPSTNNVEPQVADQYTLGYAYDATNGKYEISAEVFYKNMAHQLDYIDNANLQLNQYIEADLLPSKSRSYGLEVMAKKEIGTTTGWISYTLSKSERKTDGINQNEWFLNRYDRTHNVNVVVTHEINKRTSFSANWVYATGTPTTYADSRLEYQGWDIPYNSTDKRNTYRMPAFHRLDVSLTLKGKQLRRWKGEWVFSLYNVYARRNAYSIYFQQNEDDKNKREAIRLSIIGSVIPGITYNFKF
ncbi:TonB-dependent receptor [Chitinophaga silvisoli]|uniref:TonB-dependent receptor n=1 Tax=Chitinophaga silvisoli TaxID=2291814 RepID=A0A3E1NXM3_9BACT|nr:TonB-dependent receptor [Chitinophaga silvisoli]RFM32686.1 TonB-dependent receptor [Chitinophaga silvisoli]